MRARADLVHVPIAVQRLDQAAVPEAGMTLCVAGAGRIERSETRGDKRPGPHRGAWENIRAVAAE